MLKCLILVLILSPAVFAQPKPDPTPLGDTDAWRQLGKKMGMEVRGNDSVTPTSRKAVPVQNIRKIGAEGRRCVHMVSKPVNGAAYYFRKNYWFNINAGQKSNLSQSKEYYGMAIGSGDKSNGWHQVPKTAFDLWKKLTTQLSPGLIEKCSVNKPYFPPSITFQTDTPGCDLIKGASVIPTDQDWSGNLDHPDGPSGVTIVWNTRLTIPNYAEGVLGITVDSGGPATVGLELFNGETSKGSPVTKQLTAGSTGLFPFKLGANESFVLRSMGAAGTLAGFTIFFQNPGVVDPNRITDNITQCGKESPTDQEIANINLIRAGF